jgi:hypothetical protein
MLGSGTSFTEVDPDTGILITVSLTLDDGPDPGWRDPRVYTAATSRPCGSNSAAAAASRGHDDTPRCLKARVGAGTWTQTR